MLSLFEESTPLHKNVYSLNESPTVRNINMLCTSVEDKKIRRLVYDVEREHVLEFY